MFANLFDNMFGNVVDEELVILRLKTTWPEISGCSWEIKEFRGAAYLRLETEIVLAACTEGYKLPILSKGVFDLLTEEELFSVMAHEKSHILKGRYATERKRGESFLSYFLRDQDFERLIDDPVIRVYYGGDRSILKSAVTKVITAEKERAIRNIKNQNVLKRAAIGFLFGAMIALVKQRRFKN